MTDLAPGLPAPGTVGTVVEAWEAVVARHGGEPALSGPEGTMTYLELDARASAGAAGMIAALPPGDQPIAVLATPSPDLVTAMLGVLLTGRPLVVLDPQLPTGRLQQIQDMAGAAGCVVEARLADRVAQVGTFPVVLGLEEVVAGPAVAPAPLVRPAPGSPATIVFTSGSTGRPKGVVHSHEMIVTEAAITGRQFGLGPGERLGLVLPPSFALGEHAVFGALLSGASLHVYDPRERGLRALPEFLRDQRVTVLSMTPSLLRALTGAMPKDRPFEHLRLVVTAGEALQGRDAQAARGRLGPITIANHLGSSETGQLTFNPLAPGDPVPDGAVPSGPVVAEKEVRVLGEDGSCLPAGQVGTLVVLGAALGSYLDGPDGPFGRNDDGRATFRMGDRGRLDPDGTLHQMGRVDDAVKVNGYLVEPAEVEAALRVSDGVADAAVVAVPTGSGTTLVGYVAPSSDQRTPSPAQLRRDLVDRLPAYMVPAEFVLLDELPRNERGKVDRSALPAPVRPEPEPPQGPWERLVAGLFETVLHRSGVGRDETFTSLGGDSLSTEELLTRLAEERGVVLSSAHLAESPTVRQLAVVLASRADGDGTAARSAHPHRHRHGSVVALRTTGSRPPVLCFAGAGAGGQVFLPLAEELGPDQPVYAFQPHGLEEWTLPDVSVGMAARRHLRRLRQVQPHGPYRLVGHSMGGLVALALARALLAAGEEIASLTVIDTVLPQRLVDRAWCPDEGSGGARPSVAPLPGDDRYGPPPGKRELWRRRGLAAVAGLLPPRSSARTEGLLELGVRVSLVHRPGPWDGPATVFVSHLNEASLVVWRQLFRGEARFETLPGEHNSLLRPPFVSRIAQRIADGVSVDDSPR